MGMTRGPFPAQGCLSGGKHFLKFFVAYSLDCAIELSDDPSSIKCWGAGVESYEVCAVRCGPRIIHPWFWREIFILRLVVEIAKGEFLPVFVFTIVL